MPAAITVLKQRCIQLVCIHYSTPVNHLYYCIHVCILMIWYLSQIGVMWKHRRLQVHPRSGVRYIENNKMWPKEPIRHWNRHYAKTFMVPYSILTLMYKQWVPGIQKNWHVTTLFLLIAVRNADVLLLPLARKNAVHRATTLVYILQLEKKRKRSCRLLDLHCCLPLYHFQLYSSHLAQQATRRCRSHYSQEHEYTPCPMQHIWWKK